MIVPHVLGQLLCRVDDIAVVTHIRQDLELQTAKACHGALLLFHDLAICTRDNDFDTVRSDPAHGDLFGTGGIDAPPHGTDHLVHQSRIHVLAKRLGLLPVDLKHQVSAAGQIDAESQRTAPAAWFGRLGLGFA